MALSACCRLQLLKSGLLPRSPARFQFHLRPMSTPAPVSAPRMFSTGGSASLSRWSTLTQLRRRLSGAPKTKDAPNSKTRPETGPGDTQPAAKLTLFQKFKAMYRDYWYVLVPVHVVTSTGWIGGFYYMLQSGVDIGYYMKKVGFSESLVNKANSGAGHLAIAYAMYKVATPARYAVTLGGTTLAINSLRNLGYITPAREIIQKNKTMTKIRDFAKSKGSGSKN